MVYVVTSAWDSAKGTVVQTLPLHVKFLRHGRYHCKYIRTCVLDPGSSLQGISKERLNSQPRLEVVIVVGSCGVEVHDAYLRSEYNAGGERKSRTNSCHPDVKCTVLWIKPPARSIYNTTYRILHPDDFNQFPVKTTLPEDRWDENKTNMRHQRHAWS